MKLGAIIGTDDGRMTDDEGAISPTFGLSSAPRMNSRLKATNFVHAALVWGNEIRPHILERMRG